MLAAARRQARRTACKAAARRRRGPPLVLGTLRARPRELGGPRAAAVAFSISSAISLHCYALPGARSRSRKLDVLRRARQHGRCVPAALLARVWHSKKPFSCEAGAGRRRRHRKPGIDRTQRLTPRWSPPPPPPAPTPADATELFPLLELPDVVLPAIARLAGPAGHCALRLCCQRLYKHAPLQRPAEQGGGGMARYSRLLPVPAGVQHLEIPVPDDEDPDACMPVRQGRQQCVRQHCVGDAHIASPTWHRPRGPTSSSVLRP